MPHTSISISCSELTPTAKCWPPLPLRRSASVRTGSSTMDSKVASSVAPAKARRWPIDCAVNSSRRRKLSSSRSSRHSPRNSTSMAGSASAAPIARCAAVIASLAPKGRPMAVMSMVIEPMLGT